MASEQGDGLETKEERHKRVMSEMESLVASLSSEQRSVLFKAFEQIDRNNNQSIDHRELRAFLSLKWGELLPEETIDSILHLADVDENGRVTFDEFVRLQLRYMPICRGYCRDCKEIILGIDGYQCPECSPKQSKGVRKSFILCLKCWSKPEEERKQHQHDFCKFVRLRLGDIGKDGVGDLLPEEETFYQRNVLKPLLDMQLGTDAGEAYWGKTLRCVQQ